MKRKTRNCYSDYYTSKYGHDIQVMLRTERLVLAMYLHLKQQP